MHWDGHRGRRNWSGILETRTLNDFVLLSTGHADCVPGANLEANMTFHQLQTLNLQSWITAFCGHTYGAPLPNVCRQKWSSRQTVRGKIEQVAGLVCQGTGRRTHKIGTKLGPANTRSCQHTVLPHLSSFKWFQDVLWITLSELGSFEIWRVYGRHFHSLATWAYIVSVHYLIKSQ